MRLSAEEILVIHAMVIDVSGGSHGVRDPHLLASIAEKPYTCFGGKELYPAILGKAAILFEGLVNYHVFVDGNKRTGFVATARFLSLYGYSFTATNDAVVSMAISIASKESSIEDIAVWLAANTESL